MTRVLVTGGTGSLGRQLVPRLERAGHTVRVMSRRKPDPSVREWMQVDLSTGARLEQAVDSMQVIVHCATSPIRATRIVDVDGTRKLLEYARTANVAHFIYISIVGIDRVPYPYYQHKLAAEQVVENSRVPHTILRATQFHALLDTWLSPLVRFPFAFLPTDFQFQPMDEGECADRLVECVRDDARGRVPDVGGPEVLRLGDIARSWMRAQNKIPRIVHLPVPGKIALGFRNGYTMVPQNPYGKITWEQWLKSKFG